MGVWDDYNPREVIDFENKDFCKRCGRRWGDHLTELARESNPRACPFVPHEEAKKAR